MNEERKIETEEVDAVAPPPRARVTPEFERKRDYLAGFLSGENDEVPEHGHQRLRAMVSGADRDARVIQDGGGVVRVHPVDVEANDPGRVLGAVERDAGDGGKRAAALGDQRAFVRVDRVH